MTWSNLSVLFMYPKDHVFHPICPFDVISTVWIFYSTMCRNVRYVRDQVSVPYLGGCDALQDAHRCFFQTLHEEQRHRNLAPGMFGPKNLTEREVSFPNLTRFGDLFFCESLEMWHRIDRQREMEIVHDSPLYPDSFNSYHQFLLCW